MKVERVIEALAKEGLGVRCDHQGSTNIWHVHLKETQNAPEASVLLPSDFPVEGKALKQLAGLAAARHPIHGHIRKTVASPDFHPGDAGVAIGSTAAQEGMVIPAAVGSDINCGMRLHATDLTLDQFRSKQAEFVEALKGDFFLGTRDIPLTGADFRALFREGLPGFLAVAEKHAQGLLSRADFPQLWKELEKVYLEGCLPGNPEWAPSDYQIGPGDTLRDGGLATIGGGNHFVEVQTVKSVTNASLAYSWGVKPGQVVFMIHSGSRNLGKHIGGLWKRKAKERWPAGYRFPEGDMFSLSANEHGHNHAVEYLEAEATAANYGWLNRMLLAELVRDRIRQFWDVDAPLIYDIPHNITLMEEGAWVVRKGACPAHEFMPVIIPGSMGASSFLLEGLGNMEWLCTASHGAGRSKTRFSMGRGHKDEEALGLTGVTCITLREERRIEEAPSAYKPIQPVIDAQVKEGIVRVVAEMSPVLTFKA